VHCEICFDVYPKRQWTSDFSREILAEARRPELFFKTDKRQNGKTAITFLPPYLKELSQKV